MYTTVCQQEQPTFEEQTKRVSIITLKRGNEAVYVSSDSTKFYARTHLGMVGESVLEAGFSSVNGAPSPDFNPECIEYVRSELKRIYPNDHHFSGTESIGMLFTKLWEICHDADKAHNYWLGQHQGEY